MQPAIRIADVRKSFGALHALNGVSFDIQQGEFFGLLGPNGAGKSTLINIIAGLIQPSSGSISVMGHDVISHWRAARQSLGVVPQELVFDPFFNVRDMLRLQAGYFGCGKESWPWIDEMLDALELSSKRSTSMRALSGGMKRRVLIAQALVHKPKVVILDEPTAGVDVELRRTLWGFMRRLHAQGTTVVLTTHYLEEAQEMCSRIAILDQGEVKALEPTRTLLQRHPFRFLTLSFSGAPLPEGLRPFVHAEADGSIELKLDRRTQPVAAVLEQLRVEGCVVNDIHTREPDLEDIFVELTKK
ncbi:MAG: ABC transporter [Polycyclovorans sp.]|nr:ABC transporter [Polycyclovorans sp.]|tara:strand:- start:1536 stop:2438 length:903 start_codon:yes stop_codon:yes gene_type:complete